MSEKAIDRWKSIPLEREKRSRTPSDKEDDSDDDISIASRTPSPPPISRDGGLNDYDSYHPGVEQEVITVETKLKASNVGHMLLSKMGWKEGEGLGMTRNGRPDPIPFKLKSDLSGLGKTSQDVRMIALTVAQRRDMDSERQSRETEEQRRLRENTVAKKEVIKAEIKSTLRPFYCELCDKQYINVAQYDEHLRSYAHTHKQRFKEMEASQKPKDTSKAREKERKREERELKRLAAASGVKLGSAASSSSGVPAVAPAPAAVPVTKGGWSSGGFKKIGEPSGAVDSSPTPPVSSTGVVSSGGGGGWSAGGFKKINEPQETITSNGGDNPGERVSTISGPADIPAPSKGFSKGGWSSIASSSTASAPTPLLSDKALPHLQEKPAPAPKTKAPNFTRAGFTNLDTTSEKTAPLPRAPAPPPPPSFDPPPPPPPTSDCLPLPNFGQQPPPPPSQPPPPPPSSYAPPLPPPPTNFRPPSPPSPPSGTPGNRGGQRYGQAQNIYMREVNTGGEYGREDRNRGSRSNHDREIDNSYGYNPRLNDRHNPQEGRGREYNSEGPSGHNDQRGGYNDEGQSRFDDRSRREWGPSRGGRGGPHRGYSRGGQGYGGRGAR